MKIALLILLVVMVVATVKLCARLNDPHPRPQMPATIQDDTIAAVSAVLTTALVAWLILARPAVLCAGPFFN